MLNIGNSLVFDRKCTVLEVVDSVLCRRGEDDLVGWLRKEPKDAEMPRAAFPFFSSIEIFQQRPRPRAQHLTPIGVETAAAIYPHGSVKLTRRLTNLVLSTWSLEERWCSEVPFSMCIDLRALRLLLWVYFSG